MKRDSLVNLNQIMICKLHMAHEVHINTLQDWHSWLKKNHTQTDGVWLVYYKQSSGKGDVTIGGIIDEALCWGWVDSVVGKVDDERTKSYIAPRKPKSNWSKVNKEKVARLIKEKRMQPSGLAMVDLAKKTGTWDALNDVENLVTPKDLLHELKKYSDAYRNWEAFPRSPKRGILEWILNAKRPETRLKRIEETARLAQENIRANQWKQ